MRLVKTFDDYFEVYDDGELTSRLPILSDQYATVELQLSALEPVPDKVTIGNVPLEVSMRQARLALLHYGMLDSVNTIIASMPGIQGAAARIEWEYATSVKRTSMLVSALIPYLGLNTDQLDAMFLLASTFE